MIEKTLLTWNSHIIAEEGVIVGCDLLQENYLPWWWMNYRMFNNYPVSFVDFGDMSAFARKWCQKRGHYIYLDISDDFIAKKEQIDPKLADCWERTNSDLWQVRPAWFKKPFALLKTPFKKTAWIDLDCQIKGSIEPLFSQHLSNAELALAKEPEKHQKLNIERGIMPANETMYNTGVLVYTHNSKSILMWANDCVKNNALFIGDQQILAHLISEKKLNVNFLPEAYNWLYEEGYNEEAIILHLWGPYKHRIPIYIEIFKNCEVDLTLTAG